MKKQYWWLLGGIALGAVGMYVAKNNNWVGAAGHQDLRNYKKGLKERWGRDWRSHMGEKP